MAVQYPTAADSIRTCENLNLIHKCGLPCLACCQDSVSSLFSLALFQTPLPRPCYPPTGEVISFFFSSFFFKKTKNPSSLSGSWFGSGLWMRLLCPHFSDEPCRVVTPRCCMVLPGAAAVCCSRLWVAAARRLRLRRPRCSFSCSLSQTSLFLTASKLLVLLLPVGDLLSRQQTF